MSSQFYDFKMPNIQGEPIPLANYKGKVLLVVNTASKCGLTPQYEGLEKIFEKYQKKGFEVLGFPANEFLAQEPGSNAEIQQFCSTSFGVKFPLFSKIVVKGPGQHPLYQFLTSSQPVAEKNPASGLEKKLSDIGQTRQKPNDILWNFEKFLIGKNGQVLTRFAPDMAPEDPVIIQAIEKALAS